MDGSGDKEQRGLLIVSVYGYIRVSSKDQFEDRQLIAMKKAEVPGNNIYMDKQSGKNFDRPMYQKMIQNFL